MGGSDKPARAADTGTDVDAAYADWNERVALFWLTNPATDAASYLTVTPQGLSAAMWECAGVRLDADAAEASFVEVVRTFYARRIIAGRADVGSLATLETLNRAPLCLAFLALSVLAAYQMHADAKNRSTAYYARLAQLLDCEMDHELPLGFSKEGFESLWHYVHAWTVKNKMPPLFVPAVEDLVRRYVAYPLAHAPLRQVDLDRLPDFFGWSEYAPAGAVSLDRLRDDFKRWVSERRALTPHARAACEDGRLLSGVT